MSRPRLPALTALTALTLVAFAGNALLCRAALRDTDIDPATFTGVRLLAGAVVLVLLLGRAPGSARVRLGRAVGGGSWTSALALYGYAVTFSFAYVSLPASAGALLLFGAVQVTMIGWGLARGERLRTLQVVGMAMAAGGLVGLLLPGLTAPPLPGSLLMLAAGVAWGAYSLRGRGATAPLTDTTGNFVRAAPLGVLTAAVLLPTLTADLAGLGYATASGALTSGVGYVLWYTVLPALRATTAATLQLSVPVITAFGAVAWLGEAITLRLVLASLAVLGGVWLVIRFPGRPVRA